MKKFVSALFVLPVFVVLFISIGHAEMFLDSNGYVGIGTTSPSSELEVVGNVEAAGFTINGIPVGISGDSYWSASGGDIYYNSGNVGIWTTSPGYELDVAGTINASTALKVNGTDVLTSYTETDPIFSASAASAITSGQTSNWDAAFGWGNHALAGYDTSDDSWTGTGDVYTMSGKVGIGTTNPLAKLELYSPVALGDPWPADAVMLRLESGSATNPLHTIQIIKSHGTTESEIRFDHGDEGLIVGAIYTRGDKLALNFLVGGAAWNHVTFEDPNGVRDLEVHLRADSTNEVALIFDKSWDTRVNNPASKIYRPSNSDDLVVNLSGIGDVMTFNSITGNVGIGTTNPQGKLDVNGAIYQRGGELHADYVFELDYRLESIEEHAEFMWNNKHLTAIPKAMTDKDGQQIVEVGSHRKGIVEELEKAHIYIEQLHKQNKSLEERLAKLEALFSK